MLLLTSTMGVSYKVKLGKVYLSYDDIKIKRRIILLKCQQQFENSKAVYGYSLSGIDHDST